MNKQTILTFGFIGTIILVLIAILVFQTPDNGPSDVVRAKITTEIEDLKSQLPISIPNTPLKIEDIFIEGDYVVFVANATKEVLQDAFSFGTEYSNSDKHVARVLKDFDPDVSKQYIKAGMGLKYIYKASDTGEIMSTIEIDCQRMEQIMQKISSGEITPYTSLEIFQMEIDSYNFPHEVEEGVWLTEAYIKGNTVFYFSTIDTDVTAADITDAYVAGMKEGILEGIKESLFSTHKKEMQENRISIVYIYQNNEGEEFARVRITGDDI